VQLALASRAQTAINFEATLSQLRGLLGGTPGPAAAPLKLIQVSVGSTIRMLPVADVIYFEAADKYVRVLTASHEYLIRTALKDLLPQLDPHTFWQIHRGTLVNSTRIDSISRDESGKLQLTLHQRPERLAVSRLYAHLFRAM
jgi:DNA-binding LytR/AlgR family response regulator